MQRISIGIGIAFAGLVAPAAQADVSETRSIEESIPVTTAAPRVVVRNVWGSIRVTAHDSRTIELAATETVHADTQADLERARDEVRLAIERRDDAAEFVVEHADDDRDCGFFGCRGPWGGWSRWDDYSVHYDFELSVPRGAVVELATVNAGDITVEGVQGDFEVANVNGNVRLEGLRGTGEARTVNGNLEASFDEAPTGATSFRSVNGRIDVTFPADLAADLQFNTMHGEIWTDFPADAATSTPVRESRRDGELFVIRSDRHTAVRVGAGGPTHSFETLNGDITIREAH
jgi:hypothetical protein